MTEVSGMEGDTITLQDIFLFKLDRVDEDGKVHGAMRPTGIRPGFVAQVRDCRHRTAEHTSSAPRKGGSEMLMILAASVRGRVRAPR